MAVKTRNLLTLIQKEFSDFPKNRNIALMCPIPVGITLFVTAMQGNSSSTGFYGPEFLRLSITMNLVIISLFALALLIAEEREKKTDFLLWMASVSPTEFLAGKALTIFVLSLFSHLLSYIIIGLPLEHLGEFMVLSTLITLMMTALGIIMGLLAKDQMSVSYLGVPVIIIFFIFPISAGLSSPLAGIFRIFPEHHYGKMLQLLGENDFTSVNFLAVLGWLFLSIMAMLLTYWRKGMD